MEEKIKFDIELERVMDVLCSQIYDSPYALLRENVQNAYDAILMRKAISNDSNYKPCITIKITSNCLHISDNGIGMDDVILKNNYWKAGSSGKNTEEARKAGVVGTFGIGAMANFGVCKSLKVVTRAVNSEKTYVSYVEKSKLSLTEDCISICMSNEQRSDYGTDIIAVFDNGVLINENEALDYLKTYVRYLPVSVILNEVCISGEKLSVGGDKIVRNRYKGDIGFEYEIGYNIKSNTVLPQIYIKNIFRDNQKLNGDIFLKQSNGIIFGLRNHFGLAPIPINTTFNLAGVVNLPTLTPTAGRDAINKNSIEEVASIVRIAERLIAETLSADEECADNSRELLQYIKANKLYDLAGNICINATDSSERYRLKDCKNTINGKQLYYYEGSDKSIVQKMLSGNNIILQPANDNTRRQVQIAVLKQQKVRFVPDNINAEPISLEGLPFAKVSILSRIKLVLQNDYFLSNLYVCYAKITHDVHVLVSEQKGCVNLYIDAKSNEINTLERIYNDSYDLIEPMVKDFVRINIYPKISQYVPSSISGGANALYDILQKNKELYTIDRNEFGKVEEVMRKFIKGETGIDQVLKVTKHAKNKQTMSVNSAQIGPISDEFNVKSVTDYFESKKQDSNSNYQADEEAYIQPPIKRLDVHVDYKILVDNNDDNAYYYGYGTFLALSDQMYKQYNEFFLFPHSTRVIWSLPKIIFIFTHIDGELTLYYDIELENKFNEHLTGGKEIKSATIITENKIFVPIIDELAGYFRITEGQLKLNVRFDAINK